MCYLGSANFTQSAWGIVRGDSSDEIEVWHPKNWELGIVLPVTFMDINGYDVTHSLVRGCLTYCNSFERYGEDDVPWVSQNLVVLKA